MLKSSAQKARVITGLCEFFNITLFCIDIAAGSVAIFNLKVDSFYSTLLFLLLIVASFLIYLILKCGYVALELLTETADDIRYLRKDRIEAHSSLLPLYGGPNSKNGVNAKANYKIVSNLYYREGGEGECDYTNSFVSDDTVILVDIKNRLLNETKLIDGMWRLG